MTKHRHGCQAQTRKRQRRHQRAWGRARRAAAEQEASPTLADNKWGVTGRDLHREPVWRIYDEGPMVPSHDTVPMALAKAGDKMGEVWLWCLHCARFFQAKDLARDFLGNYQRCPFDDCGAAGFDVDIHHWTCDKDVDPLWPRSEAELSYGQRSDKRAA